MNKLERIISKSPNETFNIACEVGSKVQGPMLIGLSGELGSGKTIFAKGLAEGLGVKELITSPSFLGISESYSSKYPFVHMDFYKKVTSKKDIDLYLKKKSVVVIEWIENYKQVFKEEINLDMSVHIQYLNDGPESQREIAIECYTNNL